ncbi:MAG: hypothetical protein GX272_03330 [Epulopiscium sp.]|nr:hypothetical protein [Candidatus Epulonipiscium sp.]
MEDTNNDLKYPKNIKKLLTIIIAVFTVIGTFLFLIRISDSKVQEPIPEERAVNSDGKKQELKKKKKLKKTKILRVLLSVWMNQRY